MTSTHSIIVQLDSNNLQTPHQQIFRLKVNSYLMRIEQSEFLV